MRLTAVWFKNGEEIYRVSPVLNIVCDDDMQDITEIEVKNDEYWYSSEMLDIDADDFMIIIERD